MNWSYAAGAWDGEGSMGLSGDSRKPMMIYPYMQLTQSNKYRGFRMIEELANFLRAEGIQAHVDTQDDRGRITGGGKRNYVTGRITIRCYRNVTTLLRKIIPHMVTRKQSAQDLLRFLTLYPPRTGPEAHKYPKIWPIGNFNGQIGWEKKGERAYRKPSNYASKPHPWHVPILTPEQVARIRAIGRK